MVDDGLSVKVAASVVSAALPLGGLTQPVLEHVLAAIVERRQRSLARALASAEGVSGLNQDEIGRLIAEDPRLIPLYLRIGIAADVSGVDEVLDTMGEALGRAVDDPERVDEAAIVMSAIERLERHHVEALRVVVEGGGSWTPQTLGSRLGLDESISSLCLTGLVNAGLVKGTGTWAGGLAYDVTPIGVEVLTLLSVRYRE